MKLAAGVAAALAAGVLAAGCGGMSHAPGTSVAAGSGIQKCPLDRADRRDIARAERIIARMHRIEAPLHKWRETGPPALENATEDFLVAVGPLPPNVTIRLMRRAKSASALCGDCFNAIEADQPNPAGLVVGRKACHSH